ncbi:23S rRNA (uracil1939-C5)-methyltransferase [Rhodopseudomonas rhenobacensis]|uniref:23S rRNA (Uracil1939-C5)-methyltransferase n=1 Tax=Rhodopseudomonas rhenobacensis TaxID=87461 RepID=A0A7W8E0G8_9BRAD|nr:methyltransferase [Rhodopseudomonas rhenobacensis]MBB5048860.1 23S rRNA (uracil1939-C5)-methyltransferase [Rhodopseudomonas rhenobacensis]
MTETLIIDHVGHRGDGVTSRGGEAVFVPYALGGETVEVDAVAGHPDRRVLLRVDQPSAERIAPFCKHFGVCGGCAIQHWQPAPYQAWKRQLVIAALAQAKIDCEVAPLIDAHGAGRRRITLHARKGTHEVLKVGFTAAGSHDIVPIDACPILDPGLDGALQAAWALAEALAETGKPLDIQVTAADNGLDVDIRGSGALPSKLIAKLSRLAEEHKLARLTRHGELVLMRTPPLISIGQAHLTLPPGAFLQATAAGEATLAQLAIERCGKAKNIVDLFCGVGPFALRLAAKAKVAAYDSEAPAIAALQAAAKTPGLKPLVAEVRDLFRRPLVTQELRDVDAVVFDPPRQGAQAQAEKLAAGKVPTVVAVSCNAATFARDARILIDGGYKIGAVTPVDQFRHTPHVELVAKFSKK